MDASRATSRATSRTSILDPDNISIGNDDRYDTILDEERIKKEDDELKRLSKYFEQSREELQKKVESILNINLIDKPTQYSQKNILANPKKIDPVNIPGKPITLPIAIELRQLTVSSCVHRLSDEWRRAKFIFRREDTLLTYGLLTEKNGSKGLILAVQAHVLRNLMIKSYSSISGDEVKDKRSQNLRRILNPNPNERKDALIKSLAEILWNAGEKSYACVTLNGYKEAFDVLNDAKTKSNYVNDGLTEKLRFYEFYEYKPLEEFIRKNMNLLQLDDGVVLFLYSLMLSRKLPKLREDLQGEILLGDMEECKISLFNLVATGYATPYLHNNILYYNKKGESLEIPEFGVRVRSDIGFLYWNYIENDENRLEVDSMLKTPKYPIWVTLMNNRVAVLFCTNINLLNDWRYEQAFGLHFYGGLRKQENPVKINIDTRNIPAFEIDSKRKTLSKKLALLAFEQEKDPDIIEAIHTKWPDCEILDVDGVEVMSLL